MSGLSKRFFLLCLLIFDIGYTQNGVYLSSEDIEEVTEPDKAATQSFLYRVGDKGTAFRFYKVVMSTLLYSTKMTYQWPADIEVGRRVRLELYATREAAKKHVLAPEIIFNDRIVLSNTDSLFFQNESEVIPLRKMVPPGIAWITGPPGATYQKVDSKGKVVEKTLPAFYYTLNDTTQVCLVRAESRISSQIDPITPSGQFRSIDVNLTPYPELRLPVRALVDLPPRAELDSAAFRALDSLILTVNNWYHDDSLQIQHFVDTVKLQLHSPIARTKYESESAFAIRMDAYAQDSVAALKQIAAWNRLDQLLLPMRQKLTIYQAYRDQQSTNLANEEFKRAQDFRTKLLQHHLWNRVFGSVLWTVGRNMDLTYANPAPTYLMGGGAQLEWVQKLYRKTSLQLVLAGTMSRWKAQESIRDYSQQESVVMGAEVGIPLGIAPAGNYTLDTASGLIVQVAAGPALAYRNTESVRVSGKSPEQGVVWGGIGSLQIYFLHRPFLISLDYSYFNDRFGDLALRFGIPLYPWVRP